jgi:hypothetical protein
MSGTPFTIGQLGKLQNIINIGVTTALPSVAAKFGDLKTVLKALDGKGEILADRLESALVNAIGSMLFLVPRNPVSITVGTRHDPDSFYQNRSGLCVWDEFRSRVVSKAKPTEAGTKFALDSHELGSRATDEEIEDALPKNHIFDETAVCAIIAELIGKQPSGEAGDLENTSEANLLYTSSCVVFVSWLAGDSEWFVGMWDRGGYGWSAGPRVLSASN